MSLAGTMGRGTPSVASALTLKERRGTAGDISPLIASGGCRRQRRAPEPGGGSDLQNFMSTTALAVAPENSAGC